MISSPTRSWLFLFLCNLMWALQFTCIKLVQDQAGPVFTVWGPMGLATLLLYPLMRREQLQASGLRTRGDIAVFLMLALIGVFPAQVLVTWGTRMSTASNAAIIFLATPVCMAFFAFAFLGERMNRIRCISFAVAIAGVLMCSQTELSQMHISGEFLAGNLLILSGTMGSAFYNAYGKKVMKRYSPLEMLFYTYLAMMVVLTPLVIVRESAVFARIPQFTAATWLGLILLTVFHNYLSMVLFLKALNDLAAMQTALSIYLVTFFGVPIAAVALGERLTVPTAAGGLMVLASTLLITLWPARSSAAAAARQEI